MAFGKPKGEQPPRLDGPAGRSLPIRDRMFIAVLVGEMEAMLDARDARRDLRPQQHSGTGAMGASTRYDDRMN